MSWIKHLPPACWSTFWKSIFKQQLGCKFDIMDNMSSFFLYFDICNYICLDTSYNFLALSLLLKYFFLFLSSIHVLTSSIDVVLVLSMEGFVTVCPTQHQNYVILIKPHTQPPNPPPPSLAVLPKRLLWRKLSPYALPVYHPVGSYSGGC